MRCPKNGLTQAIFFLASLGTIVTNAVKQANQEIEDELDDIEAKGKNLPQVENDPLLITSAALIAAGVSGATGAVVSHGIKKIGGWFGDEEQQKRLKKKRDEAQQKSENAQEQNDPIFGWILRGVLGDQENDPGCKQCVSVTPIHKYGNSVMQVMKTHQGKYVFAADFKGRQATKNGIKMVALEVSDVYAHPDQNESKIKPGQKVILQVNSKKCNCPSTHIKKGVYLVTGNYKEGKLYLDSDLVQLLHA